MTNDHLDPENENLDELIDLQLRFLNGDGPAPDLSGLTARQHSEARGVFTVAEALMHRGPAVPLFEDDPVAQRLGLLPTATAVAEDNEEKGGNMTTTTLQETGSRGGGDAPESGAANDRVTQIDAPRRRLRPGRILVGAAAACLVAIGAFALTRPDSETVETATTETSGFNYVLEGEEVISADPLVVYAAPGPEPEFDTSSLGTEQRFASITNDEAMELYEAEAVETAEESERIVESYPADQRPQEPRTLTKLVVFGEADDDTWALAISDGPFHRFPPEAELSEQDPSYLETNWRGIRASVGSASVRQYAPAEKLSLLHIAPTDSGEIRMLIKDYPPGGGIGGVVAAFPDHTAVVTFENECSSPEGPRCDELLWMRPLGGFARFDGVELLPRDVVIIRALDSAGNEISRFRETVVS